MVTRAPTTATRHPGDAPAAAGGCTSCSNDDAQQQHAQQQQQQQQHRSAAPTTARMMTFLNNKDNSRDERQRHPPRREELPTSGTSCTSTVPGAGNGIDSNRRLRYTRPFFVSTEVVLQVVDQVFSPLLCRRRQRRRRSRRQHSAANALLLHPIVCVVFSLIAFNCASQLRRLLSASQYDPHLKDERDVVVELLLLQQQPFHDEENHPLPSSSSTTTTSNSESFGYNYRSLHMLSNKATSEMSKIQDDHALPSSSGGSGLEQDRKRLAEESTRERHDVEVRNFSADRVLNPRSNREHVADESSEADLRVRDRRPEDLVPPSRTASTTKRRFVLHVGPPKTGTTFLQCSLCTRPDVTEPLLSSDGYVFLGTCPYRTCLLSSLPAQFWLHRRSSFVASGTSRDATINKYGPIIHRQYPQATNGTSDTATERRSRRLLSKILSDKFKRKVNEVRLTTNHSAIAIFEGCENFEDEQIEALAVWLGRDWDVKILVAYRPLLQWLPSKYNSISKPGRSNRMGTKTLPFDVHDRGKFTELVQYISQHRQHPAETVRDNFAIHFGGDRVEILKLHRLPKPSSSAEAEDGDARVGGSVRDGGNRGFDAADGIEPDPLFHHLFCHVLSDTPRTCNAVRTGVIGNTAKNPTPAAPSRSDAVPVTVSSNPSVSLNYDILATAAFDAGIIPNFVAGSALKRSRLRAEIAKRQERVLNLTSNDFPLICLPESTTGWLLNLSLQLDQSFFPEDVQLSQQTHRSDFESSKKAFCSVDSSQVLQDPGWLSFFTSLVNGDLLQKQRRRPLPRRRRSPKGWKQGDLDEDLAFDYDDLGFDDDDFY